MKVNARLFAGVKEKAGVPIVEVVGTTVAEVRDALAAAVPTIADQLGACRFALDNEFVELDAPVREGAVVDVIPPVSGG